MGNANHSCHKNNCFSKIAIKAGISDIQQLVHTYNFHWEFLHEHREIVQQILIKHKIENVLPIITNYLPNDNHQNKNSKIYHGSYYHKHISSPLNHGKPPCKIWLQSLHYTEPKPRKNSNSDNSSSSVSSLARGEVIVDSDDSDDYANDYYSQKSKKSKKPKQKPQKKTKKKEIITKKSVKTQPEICKTEGIKIVFIGEFYWSASDSILQYLTNLKYVALNPNEDEINLHSDILKEKKINQYEEDILYLNMKTEKALVNVRGNNKWCDQGNFFMIYFYANDYMSCKAAMGYFGVLKEYKMNKKQKYGIVMVGLITGNEDSVADGTTSMCRNKFNELLVLLQENNIAYFEVNEQINDGSLGHDMNFVFRQCVYEYWMQTG